MPRFKRGQPPSGGCVLKHILDRDINAILLAAAFGRLCVETVEPSTLSNITTAAAFGRLCVETDVAIVAKFEDVMQPPSGGCVLKPCARSRYILAGEAAAFGRLCVETFSACQNARLSLGAAAFGRLCVETFLRSHFLLENTQPPSGGCVLKH